MTDEKRQPREQSATHIYRRPVASEIREAASSVSTMRTRQRVVTKHHEVQPSAGESYVRRRNRLYSARAKAPAYHEPVIRKSRTLAQTGAPAIGGQMGVMKRPLPYHHSPVPARRSQQARRSGLLWRLFGLFALLLLVILGANFALTSSAFRVEQVSVIGAHNDNLVQSIQHMGMQGQNIFLIDVVGLTARIEMLPMVASVSLEKQWPNQLHVTITERTPVLLWKTANGTYSVDRQGVVIAPVDQTAGAGALMTVVDGRLRGITSGGKGTEVKDVHPGVKLDAVDIAFAASVFAELPNVAGVTDFTLRYSDTMPGGLGEVPGTVGGNGIYIVESKAGWIAYLGGANDANPLHNRLIELQQILALAQQEHLDLAMIDLRFGLRPVYTLKHA
ncbi:MAG TPA: FtsQ-type POTRA domain-containing protein [Ktedonobacteraceae bacterium]|nr:FtsQ-type POTRA domain-containing protein [Ktedonobacteraceae bacterium]